jgi:hypothetical protein
VQSTDGHLMPPKKQSLTLLQDGAGLDSARHYSSIVESPRPP